MNLILFSQALLDRDPKTRLGVKNKDDILNHEFFNGINWDRLLKKDLPLPINLMEMKADDEENVIFASVRIFIFI